MHRRWIAPIGLLLIDLVIIVWNGTPTFVREAPAREAPAREAPTTEAPTAEAPTAEGTATGARIEQASRPEPTAVNTKSGFPDLDDYNLKFHGSPIDPPIAAPDFTLDFTLDDQTGRSFRLSNQRGNLVVLFFGYTSCPDVCPATLAQFRQVKNGLGPDAERVRFVYVTIDPERDTSEHLRTYVERFDPTFYGLSGTKEALQDVWADYDVYVNKVAMPDSPLGYSVDHSVLAHVIDTDGQIVGFYPFNIPPQYVTRDLKRLLHDT